MADVLEGKSASAASAAEVLAPVYPLPRIEMVSGRGAFLTDADGVEYLDFVSGIAVNAFGHAPEDYCRAVARQLQQLGHVSNLFGTRPATELARRLLDATGYDRVFFCNSGTEGVEAALKFARADAGRRGGSGRDVLAFKGGFHGRTAFALSATWTPSYREPFEPLMPGVRFGEFNDAAALDALLDTGVCAVIVEPVQGESGAVAATPEFLATLRRLATERGITLVFDEIQCGMGRTGTFLAAEGYGVKADITVLSKALAGGLPLGAVLMTEEVAATLKPGMHGTTFGGGPVAAAAGLWVMEHIMAPGFLASVRERAAFMEEGLIDVIERHASLDEMRGTGLLRAVVIGAGASFDAPALITAARKEKLLLVRGGDRAIRFLPPLNVTEDEIRLGLERFEAAVSHLEEQKGS